MKYLAVFVIAMAAFLGVVLNAGSQEVLPEQNPLVVGCAAAGNVAAMAHLAMTRCRQVAVVVEGNQALVTVKVWIQDQGQFIVSLALYRTPWSQQYMQVRPA